MSKPTLAQGHPITRGVKPFDIDDEWYYHMRFPENMEGITPILSAIPPDSTRNGGDGPYSGNKYIRARKGMVEVLSWAMERPDGGRGYGFTGGHYHHNWANDDYRKLMLNAILWVAKTEVPPDGVDSKVTHEELQAHLDHKR
jgi:type 1 glutamine amidotransferase